MTAEQIVRALAAANPLVWSNASQGFACWHCRLPADGRPIGRHEPDCPWRQAVEWVAAQDEAARR